MIANCIDVDVRTVVLLGNKTIMIMVIVESPTSAQMPVIWHHFVVRLTVLLVRNSNIDRE